MTKEEFFASIKKLDNGCWEWQRARGVDGYGQAFYGGKQRSAHRLSWFFHKGISAPKDKLVLHMCDNPPCVNPEHLFIGTKLTNAHDRDKKGRGVLPDNTGDKHGMAVLNSEIVKAILVCCQLYPVYLVAKAFKIKYSTIYAVAMRRSWQSITMPSIQEASEIFTQYKPLFA